MSQTRREDPPGAAPPFRSDRVQQDGGKWFFSTREGTLEGPYDERFLAMDALEKYISIVQLELIGADSKLALSDPH